MKNVQRYAKQFQQDMGWEISGDNYQQIRASLLNNYMLLTTEVSEVAEEFRRAFNFTHSLIKEGMEEQDSFQLAKEKVKEDVGKELADCLAYMCKIANFFEIDMEESFYSKMEEVKERQNKDIKFK